MNGRANGNSSQHCLVRFILTIFRFTVAFSVVTRVTKIRLDRVRRGLVVSHLSVHLGYTVGRGKNGGGSG